MNRERAQHEWETLGTADARVLTRTRMHVYTVRDNAIPSGGGDGGKTRRVHGGGQQVVGRRADTTDVHANAYCTRNRRVFGGGNGMNGVAYQRIYIYIYIHA